MLHLSYKQGVYHQMVTLEENFIWLWPCKRFIWNMVACKWLDICWTLFFSSLNWKYASILRNVFVVDNIQGQNYSWWLLWLPLRWPSCCASSRIPKSRWPVFRSSSISRYCVFLNLENIHTTPNACAHTQISLYQGLGMRIEPCALLKNEKLAQR